MKQRGRHTAFIFFLSLVFLLGLPRPSLSQTAPLWEWQMPFHSSWINDVKFAPNSLSFITGSADRTVRLWDAHTGSLRRTLTGHRSAINAVDYTNDGKMIASASADSTVRLWNAETGELIRTLVHGSAAVISVEISGVDDRLYSGSQDGSIIIWDRTSGLEIRRIMLPQGPLTSLAVSPDGRTIATGSNQGNIYIWDSVTGELLRNLSRPAGVSALAFSPDGRVLASGDKWASVTFWNPGTGALIRDVKTDLNSVIDIDFSPNGRGIVAAGLSSKLYLIDAQTGQWSLVYGGGLVAAFSPSGSKLVTQWHPYTDTALAVLNYPSISFQYVITGHGGTVHNIKFARNGQMLASNSLDLSIRQWGLPGGLPLRAPIRYSGSSPFELSPDGDDVYYVFDTNSIGLSSYKTLDFRTLGSHDSPVLALALSSDGRFLASGAEDGTIKIWDIMGWKLTRTLVGHQLAIKSLAFSQGGNVLASGSMDKTVRLWNTETGHSLGILDGHSDGVTCVAISPDDQQVAAGGLDMTIRTWQVRTGSLLRTINAHSREVKAITFSPDSRTLASGSWDRTLCFWDVQTGELLTKYSDQIEFVNALAYTPNGVGLAVGGILSGLVKNPIGTLVEGKVILNDYVGPWKAPALTVELLSEDGRNCMKFNLDMLPGEQRFSLKSSLSGRYQIRVKAATFLAQRSAIKTLDGGQVEDINFSLINGDVDGDNAITVFDYVQLSMAFGAFRGGLAYDAAADLDGDLSVSVHDYIILSKNFGLEGDE